MRRLLIILFTLSFGAEACAITLNEALEAAYENNIQLKEKREELKKRDEQVMQAVSRMLPTVRVSRSKINGKSKPSLERENDGAQTRTMDGITSSLVLTQNLFHSGADFATLMSAKNIVEAYRAELESQEQEILRSVVQHFLRLKGAESKYQHAKKMSVDTKKYVEASKKRFEVGDITKTDVARAKSAHANIVAKKAQYWSEYVSEKESFKNFTGLEPKGLVLPDAFKILKIPSSMDEALAVSIRKNPKVIFAEKVKKARQSEVKASMGGVLPKVDLTHQVRDSTHAPVYSNDRNVRLSQTTTVDVTVPIFDGGASWSKIREAKRENKKSEYSFVNANNEVTQMAVSGWTRVDSAKLVYTGSKESFEAAKIAFEGALEEEKAGIRSSYDVIQYQLEYLERYTNYIDARTSLYDSLYYLKAAMGECTAKGLGLKVKLYDPLKNYNSIKWQLIGAY